MSLVKSMVTTLKLSRRSNRQEFFLYLRLVLLSVAIVGAIGFVIQFVASYLRLIGGF